ncbi:unnamed protein product [Paramecium primaurelia]|uniref:Transmembrane protein n=2 Tax=Paramecium TaxID=5884 RepID=A0A8S1TZ75_9CILI|nr:unnamed protein product [Paramecium primaurelia]CAD8155996.1 unnamed protein product [Paramecium pentaurelia]
MQINKQSIRHIIYGSTSYPRPRATRFLESQLTASLLLQKLLYFNAYFSLLFLYITLGINIQRLWIVKSNLMDTLNLVLLLIWAVLEGFRLSNGYSGNIKEQFPELFSFVLITIVSLALEVMQYVIPTLNYPMQLGLVIILTVLYFCEIMIALSSLCTQNKSQLALMSLRVPKSENDYQIKKRIEDLRIKQEEKQRLMEQEQERLTYPNNY